MSITLYTVAEGEAYAPFAARWWERVRAMQPIPDEVIIVIGTHDRAGIRAIVTPDVNVRIIELDEPFNNNFFRAACDAATSEWIGFCGIDDQMLPHAYDDIPAATEANADIMVGTIILSTGHLWRGTWNTEMMTQFNPLPAHSPFKRTLYQRVGGFPDIHWSDWGFWLRCAKHDARPFHSQKPIAIFDVGENRETMSGYSLSETKRANADNELRMFMETL